MRVCCPALNVPCGIRWRLHWQARITDAVIHEAVSAMPAEFQGSAPQLEATLKRRRDALPDHGR
jgi:hypothetical protein